MPPTNLNLIWLTFQEQIYFQDFQAGHHGGNLGSWNGTNLAILNFHVTPMPATKLGLNSTDRLGADMIWRFSRWSQWQPSWILEQNKFSSSESLCCSDASHQVSAQSNLRFGRRCRLKIFKMADMAATLDIGTDWIYQFYRSMWPQCLPLNLGSDLGFGSRHSRKLPMRPSWIAEWNYFSNS